MKTIRVKTSLSDKKKRDEEEEERTETLIQVGFLKYRSETYRTWVRIRGGGILATVILARVHRSSQLPSSNPPSKFYVKVLFLFFSLFVRSVRLNSFLYDFQTSTGITIKETKSPHTHTLSNFYRNYYFFNYISKETKSTHTHRVMCTRKL